MTLPLNEVVLSGQGRLDSPVRPHLVAQRACHRDHPIATLHFAAQIRRASGSYPRNEDTGRVSVPGGVRYLFQNESRWLLESNLYSLCHSIFEPDTQRAW